MPPRVSPLKDALQHVHSKTDKTSKLEVKYINAVKGRGVFALSSFSKGDFVLEYRGDMIDDAESQRRRRIYHSSCVAFMFSFKWRGRTWGIDASQEDGSFGRLVNDEHIRPNCRMKRIDVDRKPHLCLFALNDIQHGEEITYDYGGEDCPWRMQMTVNAADVVIPGESSHSAVLLETQMDETAQDTNQQMTMNAADVVIPGESSHSAVLLESQIDDVLSPQDTNQQMTMNAAHDVIPGESSHSAVLLEIQIDDVSSPQDTNQQMTMNAADVIIPGKSADPADLLEKQMDETAQDTNQQMTMNAADVIPGASSHPAVLVEMQMDEALSPQDSNQQMKDTDVEDSNEVSDSASGSGDEYIPDTTSESEESDASLKPRTKPLSLDDVLNDSDSMSPPVCDTTTSDHVIFDSNTTTYEVTEADGPCTSQDMTDSIVVRASKKRNGNRVYNKRHYCLYCIKPYAKMARHLESAHQDKTDVAKALSFPKGSKERKKQLDYIRNRGNYAHNAAVMKSGNGEMVPCKRPPKEAKGGDFMHCAYCQGLFTRKVLWRHMRSCKLQPGSVRPKPGKNRVQSLCTFTGPVRSHISKQLCEKWNEMVSATALRNIAEAKWNVPTLMPFIQKMHQFLSQMQNECSNALSESPSTKTWLDLAKVCLAQTILFNRRREGEVASMPLSAFLSRDSSGPHQDLDCTLSEVEKKLCRHFSRIIIRGKRGRPVPILLTPKMLCALELLVKHREACEVLKDNAYMFARPTAMTHIRGSDCIRGFAKVCGAKCPESLTSTRLRKHAATLSTVLNMTDTEMDQLANFLLEQPADETIPPTEGNEFPSTIKTCKLPSADEVVSSGVSAVRPSSKGKTGQKKQPWQQAEVQAVEKHESIHHFLYCASKD